MCFSEEKLEKKEKKRFLFIKKKLEMENIFSGSMHTCCMGVANKLFFAYFNR